MASDTTTPARREPTFLERVSSAAAYHLKRIAGDEKGTALAAQFAMTFDAAAKRDPKILKCTPDSIGLALSMCIATNLQPGGPAPECYLIPRANRRQVDGEWQSVDELNWMISWRGMVTLAARSGYALRPFAVHEQDRLFNDADGNLDLLSYDPPKLIRGTGAHTWDNLTGVVLVAHDKQTRELVGWQFVDRETIEARRDVSDAYQRGVATERADGWGRNKKMVKKTEDEMERDRKSPWFQWPIEQALKTAVRYCFSRAIVPIDITVAGAIEADDESDRIIDVPSEPVAERPAGAAAIARARIAAPVETPPMTPAPERERVLVTPSVNDAITAALNRGVNPDDIEAVVGNREPKTIPDAEAPAIVAKLAALAGGE